MAATNISHQGGTISLAVQKNVILAWMESRVLALSAMHILNMETFSQTSSVVNVWTPESGLFASRCFCTSVESGGYQMWAFWLQAQESSGLCGVCPDHSVGSTKTDVCLPSPKTLALLCFVLRPCQTSC